MTKRILKRIVGIIIIAAIAVFVLGGVIGNLVGAGTPDLPAVVEAPWIVQTNSRLYYAEELRLDADNIPTIKGYWTLDGDEYNLHDDSITFTEKLYGKVVVIRRAR